jgi:cell division protein FtsB
MKSKPKNSFVHIILWPFKSYIRILIVFSVIGFYQYQSFRIDLLAQELRQLELKKESLSNETNTLKVKIDQLTHINRVEKLAFKEYGLISAGNDFERLVIKEFEDESESKLEPDKEVRIAGVRAR